MSVSNLLNQPIIENIHFFVVPSAVLKLLSASKKFQSWRHWFISVCCRVVVDDACDWKKLQKIQVQYLKIVPMQNSLCVSVLPRSLVSLTFEAPFGVDFKIIIDEKVVVGGWPPLLNEINLGRSCAKHLNLWPEDLRRLDVRFFRGLITLPQGLSQLTYEDGQLFENGDVLESIPLCMFTRGWVIERGLGISHMPL